MPRDDMIQIRADTAGNWITADPVLALAEAGLETDTFRLKFGDGSTSWVTLPYTDPVLPPTLDERAIYAYDLGAGNSLAGAVTLDAGGVHVATPLQISLSDAQAGSWAGSAAGGDSLLIWDGSNSLGFGVSWLLYSIAWSGGQAYAQGSSVFGQPYGSYTELNSSAISLTMSFDGTTAWQLNTSNYLDTGGGTGIVDPVSFTLSTETGAQLNLGASGDGGNANQCVIKLGSGSGGTPSVYSSLTLDSAANAIFEWLTDDTHTSGFYCSTATNPFIFQLTYDASTDVTVFSSHNVPMITLDGGGASR